MWAHSAVRCQENHRLSICWLSHEPSDRRRREQSEPWQHHFGGSAMKRLMIQYRLQLHEVNDVFFNLSSACTLPGSSLSGPDCAWRSSCSKELLIQPQRMGTNQFAERMRSQNCHSRSIFVWSLCFWPRVLWIQFCLSKPSSHSERHVIQEVASTLFTHEASRDWRTTCYKRNKNSLLAVWRQEEHKLLYIHKHTHICALTRCTTTGTIKQHPSCKLAELSGRSSWWFEFKSNHVCFEMCWFQLLHVKSHFTSQIVRPNFIQRLLFSNPATSL